MKTEQIDRGKSDALHLLHQFRQLGAEAGGLGFVSRPLAAPSGFALCAQAS